MAITEEPKRIHWNYFIAIDSDIEHLARYIEFTEANFGTYSIELVRLLLSVSSEVDVVAKLLCKKLSPDAPRDNIEAYRKVLSKSLPKKIDSLNVFMPISGLTLTPWMNWSKNKCPEWWRAYNNVKHERSLHFAEANLKNVLNAVSGLYVLLLYLYETEARESRLIPKPRFFQLPSNLMVDWDVRTGIEYYDIYKKDEG